MANDGVREFRIAALEKHMIDVVTAINALRNECAGKAELAALSARVEKLEQEFKEFRIEFTARLEVIEATMVTKAESLPSGVLPQPLHTGQMPSPLPGVPGAASSAEFIFGSITRPPKIPL
jgi:hypothetical protein